MIKKHSNLTVLQKDLINTVDSINKEFALSAEQEKAYDLIVNKHQNVFIQGAAGSGKSTFISYIKAHTTRSILLCSPTAIAAMNIGGATLHSLFKLPVSDFISNENLWRTNRKRVYELLRNTDLIIIDEISMVRPDMLDAINSICAKATNKKKTPFGGIQMVLIGDLYQLPPVILDKTKGLFKAIYGTENPYFFDADCYTKAGFKTIEFGKVFRQTDTTLLDNLLKLKSKIQLKQVLNYFNSCKITDQNTLKNTITITPYRAAADRINNDRLFELHSMPYSYEATFTGDVGNQQNFPAPHVLTLKAGALVIFVKNNADSLWINGTSGIIEELSEDMVKVRILASNQIVNVHKETWEVHEYSTEETTEIDEETGETIKVAKIVEKTIGSFTQYPLRLGYGLTIHAAQGKTLDKVIIDLGRGAFAHGQLYVALSRTRNKDDMHLITPIKLADVIEDEKVVDFLQRT